MPLARPGSLDTIMKGYAVALLAVLCALLCKALLAWLFHIEIWYIGYFLAVTISAWYGGLRPGLVTTCGIALLESLFFLDPVGLFFLSSVDRAANLAIFVCEGAIISYLSGARQHARNSLLESHQQITEFIDSIKDGFFVVGPQWQLIYFNQQFVRFTGKTHQELVGMSLWEVFPVIVNTPLQAQYLEAMERRQPFHGEYYVCTFNAWFDVHVYPSRDGLTVHFQDITERKHVEERTRFQASVLAQVSDIVVAVDTSFHITYWNKMAEQFFAVPAQEAVGQCVDRIYQYRPLTPEQERAFNESLTMYGFWKGESVLFTKGAERNVDLSMSVLLDEQGNQAGLLTVIRDSTQRNQAELERLHLLNREQAARMTAEMAQLRLSFLAEASRELARSLDYNRTLDSLARLAVPVLADWCMVDVMEEDGHIRRVALAHVDPPKEELLHQLHYEPDWNRVLHVVRILQSGRPELINELQEFQQSDYFYDETHARLIMQLGATSAIAVPLTARDTVFGVITLVSGESGRIYDEDDLALAEELANRAALAVENSRLYRSAEEAIHIRDQFLSIASHELKTPLTSLVGYAKLLQGLSSQGAMFTERGQRAIRIIVEQSDRLSRLIHALLDISRIRTGRLDIERAPIDITTLAHRVTEEVQMTLEQHTLTTSYPDEALIIEGDALRLEQVLHNLIQNAIKYSPDGSPIHVSIERQDERACILVRDHGIGIAPESLPQLFQPFYRAPQTADWQIEGMGIGLYMVKEIVLLHGGDVDVTSQEGAGSTFTIWLPLCASDSILPGSEASTRQQPPAEELP